MECKGSLCPHCGQMNHINKGKWTKEEDNRLVNYIQVHGVRSWRDIPCNAGILRCSNSCRIRWANYLCPEVKQGKFTEEEDEKIVTLYKTHGDKWSYIADGLPGRTTRVVRDHCTTDRMQRKLIRGSGEGCSQQNQRKRGGRRKSPNLNVNLELKLGPPVNAQNLNLELTLSPPVNAPPLKMESDFRQL